MTSDTATAESWRTYNLQRIEDLKEKAQKPGISWIAKVFWIWCQTGLSKSVTIGHFRALEPPVSER